tara:strand:+ start:52 stop:243 length:192 start_codon:yes stop_codon:yes gene_type:complete
MGALKNCGKVTGTILSGWLINRHDFSLMLWNMSALLAFWSFGLLLITLNDKSMISYREYGRVI